MQLNCKVIEKVGTPPPSHFYSNPLFKGYPLFLAKFSVPPKVTQFLEGPTHPLPLPPLISGGRGSNYDYGNLTWVSKYINNFPLLLKENKLPEKGNGSI